MTRRQPPPAHATALPGPRGRARVRGSICRLRESAALLRVPLQNCTRSSADLKDESKTSALKRPVRRSNPRRPPRAEVKLAQDHQHGDDGREQQANDSPRRLRDVDDSRDFPRRHIDLGLWRAGCGGVGMRGGAVCGRNGEGEEEELRVDEPEPEGQS